MDSQTHFKVKFTKLVFGKRIREYVSKMCIVKISQNQISLKVAQIALKHGQKVDLKILVIIT